MIEFTLVVFASVLVGYRYGKNDILMGASAGLCTFFAILNVAFLIAFLTSPSKLVFNLIVCILSASILIYLHFSRNNQSAITPMAQAKSQNDVRNANLQPQIFNILIISVICLAVPFFYAPIDLSSFDTIHHLGIAKQFMDSETVSLEIFSLSALYSHDIVYFAYAGATYNPIIGYVANALNLAPLTVLTAFASFSMAFLLIGAYHLSYNILVDRSSSRLTRYLIIFPILAALIVFIPQLPSEYVGHPGIYWVAYPSVFALGCVFHLIALLVRFSEENTKPQYALIATASLAAASLHTAITVAAVSFGAGYLLLRIFWEARSRNPVSAQRSLKQLFAISLPMALAIGIKLYSVHGLHMPNLLHAQTPSWLNVTSEGAIFNFKAISQKRLPLLIFSALLLIIAYISVFRTETKTAVRYWEAFVVLWALCALAVVFMYLPFVTPILIDILSAPLMFRILWFLEVILPVISATLICSLILRFASKPGITYRTASCIGIIGMIVAWYFSAVAIMESGEDVISGVNSATANYNYVHLSSVQQNKDYVDFLAALPTDSRYFVSSWSLGQGTHKRMEMTMTSAQLVTPPHILTERGQKIAEKCALHETLDPTALRHMLNQCDLDYVISWVWPIPETASQNSRDAQSRMQDPLGYIGHFQPSQTYPIERPDNKPILVKVYNIRDLN